MTKNTDSLDRSSGRAAIAIHRRVPLVLLSSIALSFVLVQPSAAAPVEGSSWSYISYYDHANGDAYTLTQQKQDTVAGGQFATEVSMNANNYAKSSAGVSDDGALTGKIAVGTARNEFSAGQLLKAYSASSYSEGWQFGTGGCGADTCPSVNLSVSLSQTGLFTLGAANFTVNYSVRTPSDFISFYFNVNDETETAPFAYSAWLVRQSLGTGQMTTYDIDLTFTEFEEGLWSFAYAAEADFTTNVDIKEELSLSGYAWASSGTEYFDSYNSFNALLETTDDGYVLTSDSGRQIGTVEDDGTVPEPSSLYLLGAGLLGLVRLMKRAA